MKIFKRNKSIGIYCGIQKIKVPIKKRLELKKKIQELLDKYNIPIMVCYGMVFKDGSEFMLDFVYPIQKFEKNLVDEDLVNQVHIIKKCIFIDKNF